MTDNEQTNAAQMQAQIMELYNKMTPENQEKARAYYWQLLAEQEAQASNQQAPQYVYFFDCLDAALSDKYWTAAELNKAMTGAAVPMPEKEIKKIAHNYEATLYRYILDDAGNPTNELVLYDCFDM